MGACGCNTMQPTIQPTSSPHTHANTTLPAPQLRYPSRGHSCCSNGRWRGQRSTQFTCFTSAKVQILTPEEQGWSLLDAEIERVQSPQALPRDALLEIEILPPVLYPADAIKKNIKKTPPRWKGEGEGGGAGRLGRRGRRVCGNFAAWRCATSE